MAPPALAPQAATRTMTTTKSVKAPTAKQYIIGALMAVLAAAVVVTVFFIVLSPARILISVADAGSHMTAGNQSVELALTLSVNNTSTRARVKYNSIYIDVSNSTAGTLWFRANMTVAMPLLQPKLNETRINASLSLPYKGAPLVLDFTGNMTSNDFAVTVTAVARFKVGFAQTRLYDIKVKCVPVSFFPDAAQVTGVPPAPQLPVLCV